MPSPSETSTWSIMQTSLSHMSFTVLEVHAKRFDMLRGRKSELLATKIKRRGYATNHERNLSCCCSRVGFLWIISQ